MFLKVQSEKKKLGLFSPMRTLPEYKRREHGFQSAPIIQVLKLQVLINLYRLVTVTTLIRRKRC